MSYTIREACSQSDILQRNKLLQTTLRDPNLPFLIHEEYPIVLATSQNKEKSSFILEKNSRVVSHANLWIRKVATPQNHSNITIGLIGNVATDPAYQGNGYMKKLIDWVCNRAQSIKLDALILWSDLGKFYHKLGFKSLGVEVRYFFEKVHNISENNPLFALSGNDLTNEISEHLLSLRPQTATLSRSSTEFRSLAGIPNTTIIVNDPKNIQFYLIIGKGADFNGVIHEWGGQPTQLMSGIGYILEQLPMTILLSPLKIEQAYESQFTAAASKAEKHHMALAKILNRDVEKELESLFVWGLDSI